MRRKKFWEKRILAVLLSAAVTFASADTRVLAAETEIAEEVDSTDVEHTVDDDGDAEESKSDNPTVETETGYVSEESGNLSETETQEMTEVQNTEAENSSEHEDIDESEIESSLPETSTTGAEENELLVETRLAVETDKSRAEAEQRMADGDEIASGQINDISWKIDKTGKLIVEGEGDCFANDLKVMLPGEAWPWHKHKDAIISAEVRVSGMTDSSYMFENCTNLTMVDFGGFETDKLERTGGMFYGCNRLESLDLSHFRTDSVTDMSYMFECCNSLKSLDLKSFQTGKVTNMSNMFHGCSSLTELDLNSFQTSRVTNMCNMFAGCEGLTELKVDHFNTGYVTNMDSMFVGCSSLINLDLHSFETDRVTNMSRMFYGCSSLTGLNLDNFNTGKVTDMHSMFQDCSSLAVLDLSSFKTDRVTNMSWMFNGCKNLTNLDLSSFETDKVADMSNMFGWCSRLSNLNLENFNTKNVTTMEYMFYHCEQLSDLNIGKFNTEKVTNMSTMFSDCGSLQYLDLSHFDTSKVTDIQRMFGFCSNLQELNLSNFDLGSLSGKTTYIFEACDKLEKIYVPCNLGITIPLHEVFGDTDKWNMNGKEITELPKKLKQSVMIVKGQKPLETVRIAAIKKHTVYECGDEFDIDDLEVYYYGTDGSVKYVTNYITNKDDIDMSNPGNQELHITYKDGDLDLTAVIQLTIREAAVSYIASGTSNDIKWEIDCNGKLTIMGSGDYDKGKHTPWYN